LLLKFQGPEKSLCLDLSLLQRRFVSLVDASNHREQSTGNQSEITDSLVKRTVKALRMI
jgi:hypothetical protein